MPGDTPLGSGASYLGSNLTMYIDNGTITNARVDDMGMSGPFIHRFAYLLFKSLL